MTSPQKPDQSADDKNPVAPSSEAIESTGSTTFDLKHAADEALKQSPGQASTGAHNDNPIVSGDIDANVITNDVKSAAQQALQMSPTHHLVDSTVVFNAQNGFQLSIEEDILDLTIQPAEGEMLVGRADEVVGFNPRIDLTPYGAYRLGISRQHAKFIVTEGLLKLIDLGSRNGTHINNAPLQPENPMPVSHGDLLQFGNMKVIIKFLADS